VKGILRLFWTLATYPLHAPRGRTTLILMGLGLLLVAASWGLGILSLEHDRRQVGFAYAPNWSITAILIWPAMFYVLRALLDNAQSVFEELDASPMAWLAAAVPGATIGSTWARHKRLLRRLGGTILLLAAIGAVLEWWSESGSALLVGRSPGQLEFDWSSIAVGASTSAHMAQSAFTLVAFLYAWFAIALMLTFLITAVVMARTMALHGAGREEPPLLIDIESNDPTNRVGFERFVIVIDYMIVFVALAFANFFLTRIQNAYLRDAGHSGSILDFIEQDFLVRSVDQLPELLQFRTLDFSSAAVSIGAMLAMFQCFFFFNATLRHAALQARNRSDHVLVRPDMLKRAKATGLEPDAVRERLHRANVWPLGYSDIMPTLGLLTICVVVIVYYRLGIYLAFVWIAGWILSRTATGLLRR